MENITVFLGIKNKYVDLITTYREDENILCGKILAKEKQLQRLEVKKKKLWQFYPLWTELLLMPLIRHLSRIFPDWSWDGDELLPMGIGNKVAVFFCKNTDLPNADKYDTENSIYICFLPGDLHKGELLYETRETKTEVNKPVESIEELIEFLNKQIIENAKQ